MKTFYTIAFLLISILVKSQCDSLPMIDSFEINNVKAIYPSHTNLFGPIFSNFGTEELGAFFQPDCRLQIFVSNLWISGYSSSGLKSMFRRYPFVGDRLNKPGPLAQCGSTQSTNCTFWNQIFKANRDSLLMFINSSGAILPTQIKNWPAKGNPYLANFGVLIQDDIAPFVDVNGDGLYNPFDGDYPKIKGDQAFFSVENDKELTFNPLSSAMNIQIKKMMYGCNGGGILNNTVFYDIDITNKSCDDYVNTIVSFNTDPDSRFRTEKIGCDSSRNLAYFDVFYELDTYSCSPQLNFTKRTIGCTKILSSNIPSSHILMKSFSYYLNGINGDLTDPNSSLQYRNIQEGKNKMGFGYEFNGDYFNYVFPSNPSETLGWSDCQNSGNDKRYVMNLNPTSFKKDSSISISYALFFSEADTSSGLCFNRDIWISPYVDSVQYFFDNNLFCSSIPASIGLSTESNNFELSPNPTSSKLFVNFENEERRNISISDMLGRVLFSKVTNSKANVLDVSSFKDGIYVVAIKTCSGIISKKFLLQK